MVNMEEEEEELNLHAQRRFYGPITRLDDIIGIVGY